jgi:hypothetical protein
VLQLKRFLRVVFLSLVLSPFGFSKSQLFHSSSLKELNSKLARQEFHGVRGALYESSVWSAIAALETRSYPWAKHWWKKERLAWPKNSAHNPYYQGKVPAYFYEKKGEKLLIVFGTSFGNVGAGTWYRKFINQIRIQHPDCSVLIFPGYLSRETLSEAKPPFADAGVRFVAFDYLTRIENFVAQKALEGKVYKKIGTVGLSGGASIVLRLLQTNKRFKNQKNWNPYLFNWGNLALSPVVSASAAADVVDAQADYLEANNKVKMNFAIEDWLTQKVLGSLFTFSKSINARYMLEVSQEPNHAQFEEVQSLVAYSVIHELAHFTRKQSPDYRGPLRLKEYYEDYSYPKLRQIMGDKLKLSYEEFSSFDDSARETAGPLRLVFAEDDPMLSINGIEKPESRAHPKVLRVISKYQANPHAKVDLHRFGGHLAYILDTDYLQRLFGETFR